jgi:hypothetical protein
MGDLNYLTVFTKKVGGGYSDHFCKNQGQEEIRRYLNKVKHGSPARGSTHFTLVPRIRPLNWSLFLDSQDWMTRGGATVQPGVSRTHEMRGRNKTMSVDSVWIWGSGVYSTFLNLLISNVRLLGCLHLQSILRYKEVFAFCCFSHRQINIQQARRRYITDRYIEVITSKMSSLESDIKINVPKFLSSSVSDDTIRDNKVIMELCGRESKWYDVS